MDDHKENDHANSASVHPLSSSVGPTETKQLLSNTDKSTRKHESRTESTGCSLLQPPAHTVTRELLQKHAAQLIEEINEKRKQNTQMIDDYRASQIATVEKVCAAMENHFIETYGKYEPEVQDKLQQLFDALARIEQLETELEQFKSMLGNLCKDMRLV